MGGPSARRVAVRRPILVFACTAMLVAIVVGITASADSVPAAVGTRTPHLGDHVEYEVLVSQGGADRMFRVAADLSGPTTVLDREGRSHVALRLVAAVEPAPEVMEGLPELARVDAVSLAMGQVVRQDRYIEGAPEQVAGTEVPGQTEYSGSEAGFLPTYDWGWSPGPHPWLQGAFSSPHGCSFGPLRVDVGALVQTRRGDLDGRPAIETTRTTAFATAGALPAIDGEVEVRVSGSPAGSGIVEDRATWVDGEAYPMEVVRTFTATLDGHGVQWTATHRLLTLVRGSGDAVSAGPGGCGTPAPAPARGPTHYPIDDAKATAVYRLDEAMATVEGDPTLQPFAMWRAMHPDARLAGFTFYGKTDDTSADYLGARWFLFYAWEKQLVGVATERHAPGAPPVSYWLTPAWSPEGGPWDERDSPWLPDDGVLPPPVSLGTAERLWEGSSQEPMRSLGINRFEWGFSAETFDVDLDGYRNGELWQVQAMHTAGSNPTGAASQLYDWVFVNVTTGQLGAYQALQLRGPVPHFTAVPATPGISFTAGSTGLGSGIVWAAAGVAALAFLGLAAKALLGSSLVPGYAKIRGDALLEHATRRRIIDLVEAEPGIGPPDLARRLDLRWSTLVHHLRSLERGGLVKAVVQGHRKRLFSGGQVATPTALALRHPTTRAVFDVVVGSPGASQSTVAHRLGLTPQALARHVRRLAAAGAIQRQPEGREVRLFPSASAPAPPASAEA